MLHKICINQICIWTQYEIYSTYRINVCINNIPIQYYIDLATSMLVMDVGDETCW